jgi:hypothetical protein
MLKVTRTAASLRTAAARTCLSFYGGPRPDLARALEFYDRWLPNTMRRITDITRACMPQCAMLRGPGDQAGLPRYD